MKPRRFQENRGCSIGHTAAKSSKYPANAHRLFLVADHQILSVQDVFLTVQGYKTAAGIGHTYDYDISLNVLPVKGMKGLACFKHYIICNIHHIRDGSNAGHPQAVLHP